MIREYTSGDLAEIKRIYRDEGYTFELPNLEHPLMLVKKVLADERADHVRMAAFGRLHISALLFVDRKWGAPEQRLIAIRELQDEMLKGASEFGLDIATTQAEGRFAERIEKDLGWTRGWGTMYYRSIDANK